MVVFLLPDVEALLAAFLRAQSEINAITTRVYTEIPASPAWPLIRLRRVGGSPVRSHPLHLDAALVQVDAYASNKATARALAETARAAIASRIEGSHAAGNVSGVNFGSMAWLPDDDFTPQQPRYVFDLTIFATL